MKPSSSACQEVIQPHLNFHMLFFGIFLHIVLYCWLTCFCTWTTVSFLKAGAKSHASLYHSLAQEVLKNICFTKNASVMGHWFEQIYVVLLSSVPETLFPQISFLLCSPLSLFLLFLEAFLISNPPTFFNFPIT